MKSLTLSEDNYQDIADICPVSQNWLDQLASVSQNRSHDKFIIGRKGKGIPVGPIDDKPQKILYIGETLNKDVNGNFSIL